MALGASVNGMAQQLPQYSQYNRNSFMVNPGACGMYDFFDVQIGGRYQWEGFTNAPMTAYAYGATVLNFEKPRYNPSLRTSYGPIPNPKVGVGLLKHAVGGQIIADQYGAFRDISFAGTYALHIPVTKKHNLSFGTKLGLSNSMFLQDRATVLSQMDGYDGPAINDPGYDAYVANQGSLNFMEIGAGIFFYGDNLYIGVAADQLTKDMIEFGTGSANFDPQMHFNVTAGYKFPVGDYWTMMPSFLAKYMAPAPFTIEGSIQMEYKEWLWFAASYRHTDAVVAALGCNLSNNLKLGYSFDYSLSKFSNYSAGGHELVLGLMIGR